MIFPRALICLLISAWVSSLTQGASFDGTVDPTFAPVLRSAGMVSRFWLRPNGNVVAGGTFDSYAGMPCDNAVEINADGSFAKVVSLGKAAQPGLRKLLDLAADGSRLVSSPSPPLAEAAPATVRLIHVIADGTDDLDFSPPPFATVFQAQTLPNGQILVAGALALPYPPFLDASRGLFRLNVDGSLDTSFRPQNTEYFLRGPQDEFPQFEVIPDGRILVSSSAGIFRLLGNGSQDPAFQSPDLHRLGAVRIARYPDGRILVFRASSVLGSIFRLSADGVIDATFNPDATVRATADWAFPLADGRALILAYASNPIDQPYKTVL